MGSSYECQGGVLSQQLKVPVGIEEEILGDPQISPLRASEEARRGPS